MKNRTGKKWTENQAEENSKLQAGEDFFLLPPEAADDEPLFATLRYAYDEIYLLGFDNGIFRQVHRNGNTRLMPVATRDMESSLRDAFGGRIHPGDHVEYAGLMDAARWSLSAGISDVLCRDMRKQTRNGAYAWVQVSVFPLKDTQNRQCCLLCCKEIENREFSENLVRDNKLLHQKNMDALRYKAAQDHARILVFEWRGSELCYVHPRIPAILDGNYDGRFLFDVWREDNVVYSGDMPVFEDCLARLMLGIKTGEMTIRLRRRGGRFSWYKVTYVSLNDADRAERYIGAITDVDVVVRSEQSLRLRAEIDPLTGACNTQTFFEKIDALRKAWPQEPYTVLRFDVAGFKSINESLGLAEGNRLLRAIARQTRKCLHPEKDVYARLTADVFAVCMSGGTDSALRFVQSLSQKVERFFEDFRTRLYFGICQAEEGISGHVLCDRAYQAQKTVKDSELGNFAFYDARLRDRLQKESYVTRRMHSALEKKQFKLFLQPKVEVSSGRVVGAEALVRWEHPEDGIISPGSFISLFERNGFIVRLDEYIWAQTCLTLASWLDKGHTPVPISVNVSRLHFSTADLPRKFSRLLRASGLPHNLLELELTESAFFSNKAAMQKLMDELGNAGFLFAMDDFGTGYSSLSTLRDLPFTTVKLDQAFVNDCTDNERSRILVRDAIALVNNLNMHVVAEGVETEDHAYFLLKSGCNCVQGFLYARPMEAETFERLFLEEKKSFPLTNHGIRGEALRQGLPLGEPTH